VPPATTKTLQKRHHLAWKSDGKRMRLPPSALEADAPMAFDKNSWHQQQFEKSLPNPANNELQAVTSSCNDTKPTLLMVLLDTNSRTSMRNACTQRAPQELRQQNHQKTQRIALRRSLIEQACGHAMRAFFETRAIAEYLNSMNNTSKEPRARKVYNRWRHDVGGASSVALQA